MIELIQFHYSPYCIVQRRILEYSQAPFRLVNIPVTDRSLVWKLTKERYYQVPILRDGKNILFEVDDNSQVLAKYLDAKLQLGLFPKEWEGVQSILWRYLENEVEGVGFKLNDIYFEKSVPKKERLAFIRHKERKFGRGCLQQWRAHQNDLLEDLTHKLLPFEEMLGNKPFLLEERPRFVDFDLFGMLGNFLYSGNYSLPAPYTELAKWYKRVQVCRVPEAGSKRGN